MDTIAAIASGGRAPAAIGIVRISGPDCFAVCDRIFRSGKPFGRLEPRRMALGELLDAGGRTIDRGLAVRFPGPHSYTGEDCAEFHCHGSPVVLGEVLAALFAAGAAEGLPVRQAGPGEFTKRAFLNGQLDLTQAEAVIDLIDAETAAAARNAAAQLNGGLRRVLEPIQEALLEVTSRFYAVVDYPDEDIQDVQPEEIAAALREASGALKALLATCRRGRVLKKGVRTAIVGLPNAGKSSLLNALAGYERAIVTDVPGTTRDTVEEAVLCGGVLLRLVDTAGLRETEDEVERLGVERSRRAMETAELILLVEDSADEEALPEKTALEEAVSQTGKPWIYVASKRDRSGIRSASLGGPDGGRIPAASVSLSALTGEGLEDLENAVAALFPAGEQGEAGSLLTDQRQEDAARRALEALDRALEALESGLTPDAVLTDAEEALDAVGELTGRTAKEEIVSRIFSRFCVGK
ncbi:MAG: tRNA uridine-5-carboxymethylaminomethyl(34) synthesis GTPase MnmE [Oscillibacter sp.]|jgi:tRNA modification GTPase|nr:tRNA uridine-5-carboxymethylaminomethyl(34) synthesis GTPase MnmE [Oscillibacter sp.]MCI9003009.1 tRNA uridine-5-carboxymethylaminomethyl(34) synthesis GTPase MnmE [Oscillibacter sp.]